MCTKVENKQATRASAGGTRKNELFQTDDFIRSDCRGGSQVV